MQRLALAATLAIVAATATIGAGTAEAGDKRHYGWKGYGFHHVVKHKPIFIVHAHKPSYGCKVWSYSGKYCLKWH